MNTDKFFSTLNSLVESGRVMHVINILQNRINAAVNEHPDLERVLPGIERVKDSYVRMRDFAVENIEDPERDKYLKTIVEEIRALAREYLFIINENRLDPFFAEYRLQKVRRRKLSELIDEMKKTEYRFTMAKVTEADPDQFLRKMEDTSANIFRMVWSLPPWAEEDRRVIGEILVDDDRPFELRAQLITALLLGILKFYDPAKLKILIDVYENLSDERLAARALTAIVLIAARWKESVNATDEVRYRLDSLSDSILTYTRLRDIVITLIKTRDTDRVSREVNEAFTSTLSEISPEMLDKLRRDGMGVDNSETGMNPEWEKLMKNKDIEERMQAINDMQLEGMDVMMQTFSRLKSFPFFNALPNWFLPFSPSNSAVAPLFKAFDSEVFDAMGEATDMCASDKYSFALGIMQMPRERRETFAIHLSGQLEGMKDMIKDRRNVRKKPLFLSEAIVFARDLYRFAKLYPKKNQFFDPFEEPLDFLSLPSLGGLLEEYEIMLAVADFYFKYGYYDLALPIYERITAAGNAERHIYERIGFSYQMGGDYRNAIDNYEKADLFSTDMDKSGIWLLKKLAFCNKAIGNYKAASEYYRKLIERKPEDLSLQYHLGLVLLRENHVEEAMEYLSKIHYLEPEKHSFTRAYARGLVSRGGEKNLREANEMISALADGNDAELLDIRLSAHLAYLNGDYKSALSKYRSLIGETPIAEFRKTVENELTSMGTVDIGRLRLILDSLE